MPSCASSRRLPAKRSVSGRCSPSVATVISTVRPALRSAAISCSASASVFFSREVALRFQILRRKSSRLRLSSWRARARCCWLRSGALLCRAPVASSWNASPVSDCSVVSCRSAASRFRSRNVVSNSTAASRRARISSASCVLRSATRRRSRAAQTRAKMSTMAVSPSAAPSRSGVHQEAAVITWTSSGPRNSRRIAIGSGQFKTGSDSEKVSAQTPLTRRTLSSRSEARNFGSGGSENSTGTSTPSHSRFNRSGSPCLRSMLTRLPRSATRKSSKSWVGA